MKRVGLLIGLVVFGSTVLSASDFPICTTATRQQDPAVAWDGENYLVVWTDRSFGDSVYDILVQQVSENGDLIDSSFHISSAPNEQLHAAIALGDTSGLVVWQDDRIQPGDIYGQIILKKGELGDTNFAICIHSELQWGPAVAWNGTDYLVVWEDRRNYPYWSIYGQVVSPNEELIGDAFAISEVPGEQGECAVAWSDTSYLVVWQNSRTPPGPRHWKIYGQRVRSGQCVGSNFPICTVSSCDVLHRCHHRCPSLVFGSGKYLVVWEDYRKCHTTGWDIFGKKIIPLAY